MKKVSGTLKLLYSQYRELQGFAQFGSDLDADTKASLARGERVVEVLKQGRNSPLTVEHQVLIIYAVTNNYLHSIPTSSVAEFEEELFEFVDTTHPDIISGLKEKKDITPEIEEEIKTALSEFVSKFISSHA